VIVSGSVAWFDVTKQFGFVKVRGGRDTFLHMSVLKAAGYTFVPAGTTLRFTVEVEAGKPRVTEIHEVDLSTAEAGQPEAVVRERREGEDA
jgi:cold shock protein